MSIVERAQMFLFSDDPARCFETFAGVDEEFLRLLARFDLLSFDWREPEVTEDRLLEVVFLRTLLRSGFPFEQVMEMLDQLQKPYRYDPARIFWDMAARRWRHLDELRPPSPPVDPDALLMPEEELAAGLRDLHSLGETDALHSLHRLLHELLGPDGESPAK